MASTDGCKGLAAYPPGIMDCTSTEKEAITAGGCPKDNQVYTDEFASLKVSQMSKYDPNLKNMKDLTNAETNAVNMFYSRISNDFGIEDTKPAGIRSVVRMAMPLEGYIDQFDRRDEQSERGAEFLYQAMKEEIANSGNTGTFRFIVSGIYIYIDIYINTYGYICILCGFDFYVCIFLKY
eukprot:GHVR01094467.1.p1 GENE.GHVR01094467.1~~GHVR01094467.1.p1  ORF type:complete len:180 (+),score=36.32 GHVR01094467.1:125-664(+)